MLVRNEQIRDGLRRFEQRHVPRLRQLRRWERTHQLRWQQRGVLQKLRQRVSWCAKQVQYALRRKEFERQSLPQRQPLPSTEHIYRTHFQPLASIRSNYKTGTSTLPCSTCGGCPSGQHRLSCGGSSAGLCMACPSCPAGQYRLGCSSSTSGTCVSCPSCPAGMHRVACNGTSEGICSTCPTGWGMCSLFSFVKACPWMRASPFATWLCHLHALTFLPHGHVFLTFSPGHLS